MHPELEQLIRLQQTENSIRSIEASLGEIPRKTALIDEALAAEKKLLDEAREASASSQKNRRQQEGELQDLEGRRSKYKGQLMEVKTNKEYSAMLHEIESVEREIRALEDRILEELEAADSHARRVVEEEKRYQSIAERALEEKRSFAQAEAALQEKKAALMRERDGVAASLSEELLALFQRVARGRGGVAVAEARDESCQLCHMRMRPQMFVDVKHNDTIIQCPSCSRVLYFEPPVPVVSHEP